MIQINSSDIQLIGIAGWRLVLDEPRHNTFHSALVDNASNFNVKIDYLGLKENVPTKWIKNVWPDSVLKKYPYLSISKFRRVKMLIDFDRKEPKVLYIFEGSFSWYFLLSVYTLTNSNLTVVCNLFSSTKYKNLILKPDFGLKIRYRILFQVLSKFKRSILTFDTGAMAELVSSKLPKLRIERFPVTSSFPYLNSDKSINKHHQVLVNLRNFPLSKLHVLMQNSCLDCTFRFPRGPLAQPSLKGEFSQYPNAVFDQQNIPVSEYMKYFDQFDYLVLLYLPSIDSSGKLLDAIARKIPVSIPRESTEWVDIAKEWGRSHTFNWDLIGVSDFSSFNHPVFANPKIEGEPNFTPQKTLSAIQAFHIPLEILSKRRERINLFFGYSLIFCHSIVAFAMNISSGLASRLQKLLKLLFD